MLYFYKIRGCKDRSFFAENLFFLWLFSLLGNKIGGINDITANHQCAFKPGYGTFAEKPAYQPQQQGGSNQYT